MNDVADHETLQSLLGAYALDALPQYEAEEVSRHLAACPKCRAEVDAHRETAAMLGNMGGQAPEGLWDRIAAAIVEQPPQIDWAALPRPVSRHRRRLGLSIGSGLVAAVAAAIAVLGFEVADLNGTVNQLQSAGSSAAISQEVATALANPGAMKVQLTSRSGHASAEAVVLPDGRGYLVATRLPRLGPDQTYQLWATEGGLAVSLGLLGNHPSEVAFAMGNARSARGLAITAERAGGVAVSANPPVVSGALPA
jgi:anti-sigma factor RsiW